MSCFIAFSWKGLEATDNLRFNRSMYARNFYFQKMSIFKQRGWMVYSSFRGLRNVFLSQRFGWTKVVTPTLPSLRKLMGISSSLVIIIKCVLIYAKFTHFVITTTILHRNIQFKTSWVDQQWFYHLSRQMKLLHSEEALGSNSRQKKHGTFTLLPTFVIL